MKSRDVKRVVVMSDDKLEASLSLGDLTARGEGGDVQPDLSRGAEQEAPHGKEI